MTAALLLLATLLLRTGLWAQASGNTAPSFSSTSIVSSASDDPASLTPNGLTTIYGTSLSYSTTAVSLEKLSVGSLPTTLGGVRVVVGGLFAGLLYVSPTQINFLMPSILRPGSTMVSVAREGTYSQQTPIQLLGVAPAVFVVNSIIAAEHADGSVVTADTPAHPGEVVVVYCTGLGDTNPRQIDGAIPAQAARILMMAQLQVLLDSQPVPAQNILYAGITPGYPGLYQINVTLPGDLAQSPELRVAIQDQVSQSSLQLPLALWDPQN